MAPEDRAEAYSLINRLYERPHSFHFYQAVRRLECAYRWQPAIGYSLRPAQDPVRFCQEPSLAFAPATMGQLQFGSQGCAPRLFVAFMGLLGPQGPMPLHITEQARQREISGDHTLARFLDIFNHRMVSLFYRAWAANQQAISFEHGALREPPPEQADPDAQPGTTHRGPAPVRRDGDRFAIYIGSLFGLGMPSLRHRDAAPDVAKLHYSGRLVCQTRHAEGLRAILHDYFRVPVEIREFLGQWIDLPSDCGCRLGESPATGTLGHTAICGSRIWDCQQKFRIVLGPMTLDDYERMLPGGRSLERLVAWIRNYIGDELTCDVQLVLKKEEVPQTKMGTFGRLGWTTWLRSQPFDHDADDLVLTPLES